MGSVDFNSGGAICNLVSTFLISDCEFVENSADYGGAIYVNNVATDRITNEQGNYFRADAFVDLYQKSGGPNRIINCVFSENRFAPAYSTSHYS